jgi:hypothetical protein
MSRTARLTHQLNKKAQVIFYLDFEVLLVNYFKIVLLQVAQIY